MDESNRKWVNKKFWKKWGWHRMNSHKKTLIQHLQMQKKIRRRRILMSNLNCEIGLKHVFRVFLALLPFFYYTLFVVTPSWYIHWYLKYILQNQWKYFPINQLLILFFNVCLTFVPIKFQITKQHLKTQSKSTKIFF